MNEFFSLVFAWTTQNHWLILCFKIVGMGIAYLVITTLFAHGLYWNTWRKKLFSLFGYVSHRIRIQKKIGNRKLLVRQIPLFLQTLSNAVKAGYSLEQAFQFIAAEIDPPLQYAVQNLNEKIELHISMQEVLEEFAQIIHHPDVDFFVESTIIQLRTGGNLVELFYKVSDLVEAKRKLARDIKSFTSQGKMSGILIAILYPVSLILFALLAPSHVETLFFTSAGQCLLVISILLELLGFVCIWKIIRVKI